MSKTPTGFTPKDGKYYCRIQGNGFEHYISLQTDNEVHGFTRCDDVNQYRKLILNGEMTPDEVVATPSISKWYRNSESKLQPFSIQSLANKWLKLKALELAPTTLADNTRNINTFIYIVGNKKPKELTVDDIDTFKAERKLGKVIPNPERPDTKLRIPADTSINRELTIIGSFIGWLHEREHIDRLIKVKHIPVKKDTRPKYISEEDFMKFLAEEKIEQWVRDIARVYWFTGCRRSELINGTLKKNRLFIDSKISKSGSEHTYPIPAPMMPIVQDFQNRRDAFVNTKNKRTGKNQTIASWKGKVSKLVIAGYKAIGIYEEYRTELHSLRHSFGCRMYMITADAKEVSRMMNHKNDDSTKQYIGLVDDILIDFPTDAPHSAFKDNMERVAKANKKTMKYLMKSNKN